MAYIIKKIKIQKWREIDKLKEYKQFRSLDQLYKHVILKENQICKYCDKVFDIDKKTKQLRSCTCLTSTEKENMHVNNFFEIYDSGNYKYIYGYDN